MMVEFPRYDVSRSEMHCPATQAAGHVVAVRPGDGSCADPSVSLGAYDGASDRTRTAWPDPLDWTEESEKRFEALVIRLAQRTITPDEEQELRQLRVWRRRLHHPLSGEAVAAAYRRDQVLNSIEAALHQYVAFHHATS
jgi:hypothetical protein